MAGRSVLTSKVLTARMKPDSVDTAVAPIRSDHHSSIAGDTAVPRRSSMVARAQTRAPSCSTWRTAASDFGPIGVNTLIILIFLGAKWALTAAPILAPTTWTERQPSAAISAARSSASSSRDQRWSAGMGVERPKPRWSTRTTRYCAASRGIQARHAAPLSARPCTSSTVSGSRQGSV